MSIALRTVGIIVKDMPKTLAFLRWTPLFGQFLTSSYGVAYKI